MNGPILFISDVHADKCALEAILQLAGSRDFSQRYGRLDRIINLGDVLERGYSPREVIDRLKGLDNLESVLGNHDEAFLYSWAVSGNDEISMRAHEEYRDRGGYEEFFRGMARYYIDMPDRLFVVHGGPLDPCAITPGNAPPEEAWLYSQTWQRISRTGTEYMDYSGYHYLPADAFDVAGAAFNGDTGYIILCGHEHAEAAFRYTDDVIEDILWKLEKATFNINGRRVEERKIIIEEGSDYLVRLGIAGPEGYYRRYGWDRCHFGVLSTASGRRVLSLLSFDLGRSYILP